MGFGRVLAFLICASRKNISSPSSVARSSTMSVSSANRASILSTRFPKRLSRLRSLAGEMRTFSMGANSITEAQLFCPTLLDLQLAGAGQASSCRRRGTARGLAEVKRPDRVPGSPAQIHISPLVSQVGFDVRIAPGMLRIPLMHVDHWRDCPTFGDRRAHPFYSSFDGRRFCRGFHSSGLAPGSAVKIR